MKPEDFQKVLDKGFNDLFESKIMPLIGKESASAAKSAVESMKAERYIYGRDISGLSEKTKKDFVAVAQAAVGFDGVSLKANEALIEEQDNRGGYLVSRDVADAIMRIAASVGTIMNQCQKWPMKTDELGVPNYTGAFLTGAYLGVDVPGVVTGLTFGQAVLIAKKWQLAFVVGNDLLADASVQLADWLLALAGEALANMIDQQGFIGTGAPFVGVLNFPTAAVGSYPANTTGQYFAGNSSTSGKTTFASWDVLVDSSNLIGQQEESVLDGSAFYMHRTVWASLRVQKDTAGNFILPLAGIPSIAGLASPLEVNPLGGPIRPAGQILGFPVYTNRWMPALSATAVNTPFIIFGNFKAAGFGDKGEMRVEQYNSGAFGGKEIALADQRGIVYKHRHAFSIVLPGAFQVGYTSAS